MKALLVRVALIPLMVWVVATLSFFLLRAVPGGPFDRERAAASREVAGPSRALLLYLWCSAPMEKPFLPLGICCARRSRRQKASVAL